MICKKCAIDKAPEEFPFTNKTEDKRSCVCKVCQREYKRKHYRDNKEAHYRRNELTEVRIRTWVNEYKSRLGCSICEESDWVCLDMHHLDPAEKEATVSQLVSLGSLKRVQKEIDKCIVLCANCHRKVHAGTIQVIA